MSRQKKNQQQTREKYTELVSGIGRKKRRKGARQESRERERVPETEGKGHAEMGKWQKQRKRLRC